ncbi:hypothetical protein EBT31_11865 [bacterium]|nr:hypothetical protein [bacterium]
MLNSKALAASASAPKVYIEDVFSTWLYTGNGSTQTITNGIDLSGKGGLVWIKGRGGVSDHILQHNTTQYLSSSSTAAASDPTSVYVTSFGSTGFSLGFGDAVNKTTAPSPYASWTFRKAAKFFDVVTYTGDADFEKVISHNLGTTPGCIIVKAVNDVGNWNVYHRSNSTDLLRLNLTNASVAGTYWGTPTSTTFTVKGVANTNAGGTTYVAYLFAHDAGGFGDSGNDSVVKCGSYTGNGSTSGPTIDLGWEPQWLMLKRTSGAAGWYMYDNMRGVATGGIDANLQANSSSAESASFDYLDFNSTGFKLTTSSNDHNGSGDTYIYIAIRRGPMKTPTDATKVFSAITSSSATGTTLTTNFPLDFQIERDRVNVGSTFVLDRLRGVNTTGVNGMDGPYLRTNGTTAETSDTTRALSDSWSNVSFKIGSSLGGVSSIYYSFRRAPGFMDVVAYTGTGSARTVSHNLGVVPELMIVKSRSNTTFWIVYSASLGNNDWLGLNSADAQLGATAMWNTTNPTASVFSLGNAGTNLSGYTYIAYLFATCPGVSKCFNFTGTGTTLQIDCGFTNGARFVMIKRTDSTGDWYVWDSARGIISGNDSYLLLNSTAAEVTNTDYIDPYSAGFEISSTAPAAINANGGSYIGLAIA